MQGGEQSEREFAGVGFVIKNEYNKYLEDIAPTNARIMSIRLASTAPITLHNVYAPQSGQTEQVNQSFYQQITEVIRKTNKKGP